MMIDMVAFVLGIVIGSLFGTSIALFAALHYFEKWTIKHLAKINVNLEFLARCIGKELPIK